MDNKYTPQWLKEVLKRGYNPDKFYHNFDNSLFSYIKAYSDNPVLVSKSKSFVLEGLPGAGKTSILKNIHNHSQSIAAVRQILPREPDSDRMVGQEYYLRSEELKARAILQSNKPVTLLDRYYVSTLAFYWALDRTFETDEYDGVFKWYHDAITAGRITPPFMTFFIEVDPVLSINRKERTSSDMGNVWENIVFLSHFGDYYKYFYKDIEPRTKVIYISGQLSLKHIQQKIEKVIDVYC